MNKNFALIGAAGYIAPRHLEAIKNTKNDLLAALDKFDSIGIIDSYFPNANFFTEFERFDRFIDKKNMQGEKLDYLTICSPNYLHDSHIRFGLRNGMDVICEKPLVLNDWNIPPLLELESRTGKQVNTILQLRLHDSVVDLKARIDSVKNWDRKFKFKLHYITSRGKWYHQSWKGNIDKSGGIATNIGIHFFDMLGWIFGEIESNELHMHDKETAKGKLIFEKAEVDWLLSIDYNQLPEYIKASGKRTYRSITIEEEEIEFSKGFTELHLKSYKQILKGNGFRLNEAKKAIKIAQDIRMLAGLE